MHDPLLVSLLSLLPRRTASTTGGAFTRTAASRWLTGAFVRAYGIDLSEADPPELSAYPTLDALFTRTLRPGARPIDPDPSTLVSPADGAIGFVGQATEGVVTVHGQPQHLDDLAMRPVDPQSDVLVVYLSPTDYHRVHSPLTGTATRARYRPADRWPVFPRAVAARPNVFGTNERLNLTLDSEAGTHDTVLVGAFGVGRIGVDLPPWHGVPPTTLRDDPLDAPVTRGGPLGVFHLGSTVVLIAPKDTWRFTVAVGDKVKMGERVGVRG